MPGDNPVDIASGPTVGDETTRRRITIVDRYQIELPPAVLDVLQSGAGETIKPDDSRLRGVETHLIGDTQMALEAAAAVAQEAASRRTSSATASRARHVKSAR